MKPFIQIPIRHKSLDPENREQVKALIEAADAKFRLSAKAWEEGNNSGCPHILRAQTARERRLAAAGAAMLAPLGIKCDWPGLYPSFAVGGYTEYTTEAAVLAALGKPRNWLKREGGK